MYNVVVVDDEEVIRYGLSNYINGTHHGFRVVGTFEDGKEAIAYIKDNEVDVVITDIKMSEVSGIEVAKYIHEEKTAVKTVIISGYKEFEYAKAALEYDVEFYLIKPTKLHEVNSVLESIKSKLDAEHEIKLRLQAEREQHEELLFYIQQLFFIDIFFNGLKDEKEINKKLEMIDANGLLRKSMYCQSNIEILEYDQYISEQWNYTKDRLTIAINNLLQARDDFLTEPVHMRHFHIDTEKNILTYLTVSDDYNRIEQMKQSLQSFFECVTKYAKEIFNLKLVFNIECVYCNFDEIMSSHKFESGQCIVQNKSSEEITILKAKEYIEKNYHNDISLDEIARHVMLNPVYFSRFFKQKTGENFSDYLIGVRIRAAIELLGTGNYKIYEISSMVGYGSSKYFARLFRLNTGYAPKEYCRKVLMQSEDKEENC